MNNYDLPALRKALITLLSANLKKGKYYKQDYEDLVSHVNKKTRGELVESYNRVIAINNVSKAELIAHCRL